MDVGLLVEVVAVLADVVQGGVDGGIIPAPTLVRHPAIPLTTTNNKHMTRELPQPNRSSIHPDLPADEV